MALRHYDGFDLYVDALDVTRAGYARSQTNATFSSSLGRYGGGALKAGTTASQGWSLGANFVPGDTVILCFAYKYENTSLEAPLIDCLLFTLYASSAGVLRFVGQSSGTLATSEPVVTPGIWHWIECKVRLGTTNSDGSAEIRVDGVPVINLTGIDTFSSATSILSYFTFVGTVGSNAGNASLFDDLIIMDGTGSTMNDFIGDCRIETLLPNADGGVVNWAPSAGAAYECVDDALGATNDDTDYISSSVPGQEARFDFAGLSSTPVTIPAVQVRYRARKDDAGQRTIRGLINSGGSESVGPERGLSTDWAWQMGGIFVVDPDTSDPWDASKVNALQAGVEVVT